MFAQLAITLKLATVSILPHQPPNTPRVYAVTGKSYWIASCLSFMSFAQAALGIAELIRAALRPGMISLPAP